MTGCDWCVLSATLLQVSDCRLSVGVFFPPVCGDVGVSGTSWNLFELKQKCVFDVMVLLVVACAFKTVFVDFLQNPSNTSSGPF